MNGHCNHLALNFLYVLRNAKTDWPFQGGTSVVVPYCYLFLLSVFILWFSCYVNGIFCKFLVAEWLPVWERAVHSVPFLNCCQFMYLVISFLGLGTGCGVWLYQFLIIAYFFTFLWCIGYLSFTKHRIKHDLLQTQVLVLQLNFLNY